VAHSASAGREPAPSTLAAMPDVLTWTGGAELVDRLHGDWLRWARDAMSATLARLREAAPDRAAPLSRAMQALAPEAFDRFLLAPEVTFRLRGLDPSPPGALADQLHDWICAERARAHPIAAPGRVLWTARGDGYVDPAGGFAWAPRIEGWMPIDVRSPWSLDIDLTGVEYRVPVPRSPLDGAELDGVLAALRRTRAGIEEASPLAGDFVARFTKVLVLQRDSQPGFTSGSNCHYLGRSVLANPQQAADADLAEGIVHEAIHALLTVQEDRAPWVLDEELYLPVPRLRSPWTDRMLPVRPFLQACFVWYGVLHFWIAAIDAAAFAPRATFLLRRALSGFLRGAFADVLAPLRPRLSAEVSSAVDEMQDRVVRLAG
jgi:hypothetical protein